ncbi:MAG: hypothetical protein HY676_01440 [Chloroflexi bacterium]|nr:hypothetical protein [Chloroflexota bacterium]
MSHYRFQRECRTRSSEVFVLLDEDEKRAGQVDLHYTSSVVHGTLTVPERLTQDEIQNIIEMIDQELVMASGIAREDFIVTVFQGREAGVYSDEEAEMENRS